MTAMTPAVDRWEPWRVDLELSVGPSRVYDSSPPPVEPKRPFGFLVDPDLQRAVRELPEFPEPLLWDGDQA